MGVPAPLKTFWRAWRALAAKLGHFNGLVLLTVLYWLVISVVALLFAACRRDPLDRRWRSASTLVAKHLRTERSDYQHIY